MGKILVFVSIVITLLSAAIGFVNKGKITEARAGIADAEAKAAQVQSSLTQTQGELKTAQDSLATTTAEKAALDSQIAGLKSASDAATAQATTLAAQKKELEDRAADFDSQLQALKDEVAKLQAGVTEATPTGPDEETKALLAEKEALIAKLQSDVDANRAELETLRRQNEDRVARITRKSLEGRVLAVNPAWNFVVLNLGDKNGIANNSELLVKRGSQLIGKVRITSVEPSTSIADIVANSVPQGTSIAPNDQVIFQSVEE